MMSLRRSHLFLALALFGLPAIATAGSETPPPGAPWQRDFGKAQQEALKSGKPIFIYFTKTY